MWPRQPMPWELTLDEVAQARDALEKMHERMKAGKRRRGRWTKLDQFYLSLSQVGYLAKRYKATRNEGRQVDYKQASET